MARRHSIPNAGARLRGGVGRKDEQSPASEDGSLPFVIVVALRGCVPEKSSERRHAHFAALTTLTLM